MKMNEEREGPIEPAHHERMNKIAGALNHIFKGYGFALLVFDFNTPGRMNYISNARRADMLRAMKEFIERNEREHGVAT